MGILELEDKLKCKEEVFKDAIHEATNSFISISEWKEQSSKMMAEIIDLDILIKLTKG